MKKLFILFFVIFTCNVASYSQTYNYDVNGDGHVTAADVTAIYDYLLGNVPPVNHEYVDLGLPSGTLWATMNIGANSPEGYGDYFYFGKTTPISYNGYNGYNGFTDSNDAAYVNWGSEWRMPSLTQIQELIDNCTSQWTTMNGVNGRLFTGPNGKSLFLPAAGYRRAGSQYSAGSSGHYWSRTYQTYEASYYAYYLHFNSEKVQHINNSSAEYFGYTVRAVWVGQP